MTASIFKRIAFVAPLVIAASISPAFAQASPYQPQLDTFLKAFQTKDYDLMKSLLDPQVKIGNVPAVMNDSLLHQMLDRLPAPSSYSITNSVTAGNLTTVNTLFKFPGRPDSPQIFVFNSDGKITSFQLPKGVRIAIRTEEQTVTVPVEAPTDHKSIKVHLPKTIEMPFALSDNVPVVTAEINGKQGKFLLDSGSDDLLLNSNLMKQDQLKTSNAFATGVGGTVALKTFSVNSFNWHGLTWSGFDASVSPIPAMKDDEGHPITGLIGYQVFKDYQVTLDYARKKLILVLTDKNGGPLQKLLPKRHILDTIHFTYQGTSPVFPVSIGGKVFQMCLDTGAGANLLYAKYFADLKGAGAFVPGSVEKAGLGGISTNVAVGNFAEIKKAAIGKITYDKMGFVFDDATLNSFHQAGLKIDGLVGYQFLRQHPTSINFKARTITIYANK